MNISDKDLQDLSLLMQETGNNITNEYHSKGFEILESLGLLSEFVGTGPVPLEIWTGIAQAVADASGYCVTLKVEILEPLKDTSGIMRSVGQREVVTVEPTSFLKEG